MINMDIGVFIDGIIFRLKCILYDKIMRKRFKICIVTRCRTNTPPYKAYNWDFIHDVFFKENGQDIKDISTCMMGVNAMSFTYRKTQLIKRYFINDEITGRNGLYDVSAIECSD